ncbi:hypothetical protein MOP44_02780 [Occallatibacter riparius]|uniref:Uncharacterized protein n=1 Tax=Occallatibacter riparius TaxID=1002689 RepID=A0A9J7BQ97_9BACT|nr:hypothetical protein [Occallatibacter riparius]UWZ84872.1 hypothetical protein MOP44_02780 [Occallatibacter riparius]
MSKQIRCCFNVLVEFRSRLRSQSRIFGKQTVAQLHPRIAKFPRDIAERGEAFNLLLAYKAALFFDAGQFINYETTQRYEHYNR